jgi:hypothetical protein
MIHRTFSTFKDLRDVSGGFIQEFKDLREHVKKLK